MSVSLRNKKLKNGQLSLYLDYYPAIINPKTGKKTRREFLSLYIYEKPKSEVEKRHNRETSTLAEKIKGERGLQVQNEEHGLFNKVHKKKDFLAYFKELTEDRFESAGNYGNWLSAYNHLENFTDGECSMGDINERFGNDLKKYLLSAKKVNTKNDVKLSRNSAVSYFNKFRAAVNQAFEERYLNENPLSRIKGIKAAETKREFLTEEELSLLYKTECEMPVLKAAAIFSALSGLRFGDIKKLIWSDMQYSKERGWFIYKKNEKTNSPDYHPISDQAVEIIGKQGKPSDKVFLELKYSAWNNVKLDNWIKIAGINKKISFHCFRHSYASILINKGVDIFTISKLLNHKNINTTMIYLKLMGGTKKEAAHKIRIEI